MHNRKMYSKIYRIYIYIYVYMEKFVCNDNNFKLNFLKLTQMKRKMFLN